MDPQQSSALNALAPYLALVNSATSPRAAVDLIKQATSAPNTYVFAELLQTPNIQALRTAEPQHARWLRMLEIFSWGTWSEYQALSNPPELNAVQTHKLKLLTLLTLAQTTPKNLTYPSLLSTLSLASPADLEALLTAAIYAGLITGKLNPRARRLDLVSVAPLRDLAPGSVPALAAILGRWEAQCGAVLREVEGRVVSVKRVAEAREEEERGWKAQLDGAVAEVGSEGGKKGVTGGGGVSGMVGAAGAKREGDDIEGVGGGGRMGFGRMRMG